MVTLADAVYLVVRGRRKRMPVSDLVQIAVDTYHMLYREHDIKPEIAQKIVDWYLA